jgi:hypothetical protein
MAIGTSLTCELVQEIERNDCLGNGLLTINQNLSGINLGMCRLTNYFKDFLQTRVDQLSARLDLSVKQLVPVGSIQLFSYIHANTQNPDALLPHGWYPCDGRTILISTHQDLADILYIGNINNNNLSYSFGYKCTASGLRSWGGQFIKLPDTRGYFTRGHGVNSDGSKSDIFAKKVADAFQGHYHNTFEGVGHHHLYTEPNNGDGHDHRIIESGKGWGGTLPTFDQWVGTGGTKRTTRDTIDITILTNITKLSALGPTTDGTNSYGNVRVNTESRARNVALQYGIKWYNAMI